MNGRDGGSRRKTEAYATFGNTALLAEVRRWLPDEGRVLDVGCASGGLLAHLDGARRRVGVEPDPDAAASARLHADEVHVCTLDELDVGIGSFDVVVLGDVLEHVADPADALRHAVSFLDRDGVAVISLPNVAHWSVRLGLLRGRWDYTDAGILDDDHLRFFTWASAAELVARCGLTLVAHRPVVTDPATHVGGPVPAPARRAWRALGRRRPGLFAFQQLLVVRPA